MFLQSNLLPFFVWRQDFATQTSMQHSCMLLAQKFWGAEEAEGCCSSSPIATGDQGNLWALVEESRRTASREEGHSGEARSEDGDHSDEDDGVDISDTSDDSDSDIGGEPGYNARCFTATRKIPCSAFSCVEPTKHRMCIFFSWVQLEDCCAGLQAELHVLSCFSAAGH